MKIGRGVFGALAFVIAAFGVTLPSAAQEELIPCDYLSATGHIEVIGSQAANFGRHIIYSFSAIQTGEHNDDGTCKVNGQLEEFLYNPDPSGDLTKRGDLRRRSHGDVVCIGVSGEPDTPQRTGEPPLLKIAHMAARVTDFYSTVQPPTPTPPYWVWKVQDNGEGSKDAPDYGSAMLGVPDAATAYAFCKGGDQRLLGPSIKGNVQVRP